jgi:1-hydroxycarotenoid 3,4-desaturase
MHTSGQSNRPGRVIVVGAGIGGLASALHLAARGLDVTVLEAASASGGKLQPLQLGPLALDCGPTVFTMRWVFDELAALAGQPLDGALGLAPLPVLARHHWPDGSRLDLHADHAAAVDAIARFASPEEARRYEAFCERARRVHDTLLHSFMTAQRPRPWSLAWRVAQARNAGAWAASRRFTACGMSSAATFAMRGCASSSAATPPTAAARHCSRPPR